MIIKKLVFLGTLQTNLHALAACKAMPRADTDVHLITPHDTVLSWGMWAGLVAGRTGMELAMALQHRPPLCRHADCGASPPAASASLQQRVLAALQVRNITVLQDNCSAIEAHCMHLSSGASLLCDMALLTDGGQPLLWLIPSGFALDTHGKMAVNSFAQSPSYTTGFAPCVSDGWQLRVRGRRCSTTCERL